MRDCPRGCGRLTSRRNLLAFLCGAIFAWPRAVGAERLHRVGMLLPYIESEVQAKSRVVTFQTALHDRGWEDHQNIEYEIRYVGGRVDRLPALAADLVHQKVDVILTAGTESTDAARKATTTIPIVMAAVGDPEAAGFIASLARPGGNVTGSSLFATELTAKRLELLKEANRRSSAQTSGARSANCRSSAATSRRNLA